MYGASRRVVKQSAESRVLDSPGAHRFTVAMDSRELLATARMARLTLAEGELAALARAVEQMLEHFSQMRLVDVEGLAPTTHALVRENRLRDDAESVLASSEELLRNAPEREERFIVIPNVL
jgi:aspartyl-tRNA(Asn)/glutamyl-tRNA(Gln) amidotransferase subunit C